RRVIPDEVERRGDHADRAAPAGDRRRLGLHEPRRDGHALGASERPGELPPLPAGLRPPAARHPCSAARRRSSLAHLRPRLRPAEVIQRKRDGEELAAQEIAELVSGFTRGDVPDYQMSAFLMAVYFRGLSGAETYALTDAMIASGETIDLAGALGRKVVDKH